jgi:hypothetical protein
LLISKAADKAAERLTLPLPEGARVFVDASYLGGIDSKGTDGKYALGALRERLLKLGAKLVPDKFEADVVVACGAVEGLIAHHKHQTKHAMLEFGAWRQGRNLANPA